jgi:amidase
MALGSDGMGSIRIPSTWCGLFGIKPQRDRVPLAPHDGAWNGLSDNGPMARTVEDAAVFLDATSTTPAAREVSSRRQPRIRAIANRVEYQGATAADGQGRQAQRARRRRAGRCCASSAIRSSSRDPDYPTGAMYGHLLPRYFRGVHDDVQTLPHRSAWRGAPALSRRIGGLISDRRLAAIRESESTLAQRVLSIFDDVDVVITPGTARAVANRGIPATRAR